MEDKAIFLTDEIIEIGHWKYKVVSDSKGKELHALYKDAHDYDWLKDTNLEWIIVSDISEMRLWRFNQLVDMLGGLGHHVAVIDSVFSMEMVFKR